MKYFIALLCLFFSLTSFSSGPTGKPKLVDLNKVKRISYLLAASRGVGKSSFGHSYLRFSYKDRFSVSDIVIEFVADVAANNINALRGIGIGKKYDALIVSTTYKNVKLHHNISEDRDLTTYPMKLTIDQKTKLTELVNKLLVGGLDDKYTFFNMNCAKLLSRVLEVSIDDDIKGLKTRVPVAMPKLLRKNGLLTDEEVIDYGVTQRRKDIFAERFPKEIIEKSPLLLQNIEKQVSSKKLAPRILAYTKLHLLRDSLDTSTKRKLNIYALKTVMLETHGIRNYILPYFTKKHQSLRRIEAPLVPVSASATDVESLSFEHQSERVYLDTVTKRRKPGHPAGKGAPQNTKDRKTQLLPSFTYTDGKIVKADNVLTRKYHKEFAENNFFDEHFYLSGEVVKYKNQKYVLPIMAQEIAQINKERTIEKKDLLSVKNGHKLDGKRVPMCYSTIEMQQLLVSRVIWAPELGPLSEKDSLKALTALYSGKIVVIPGFDNVSDFTRSLNQDSIAKIMKNRHDSEYNFSKRAKDWFSFSDTKVKSQDVYALRNLLKIGIYPKVYFKVEGRKKGAVSIAHGVLITKIEEDDNFFHIEVYDPNVGIAKIKSDSEIEALVERYKKLDDIMVKKGKKPLNLRPSFFRIDKKTSKLITGKYKDTKMILPKISLADHSNYNLVMQSEKLKKRAIRSYELSNNFIYSISDFFR